jgi:hypothetical protein
MLHQNGASTVFKIDNGSLEISCNSNAAQLIRLEYGQIEWTDAIVRSGAMMYVGNTRAAINNACISSTSFMVWVGVGTSSNFSTMINAGLFTETDVLNSDQ